MSALTELQEAVAATAQHTGAAVVAVGRGAGVVVGDGHIVTNAHNLGDEPIVRFADGRTAEATLVAADLDGDLAVLAADTGDVTPVTWGEAAPSLGGAVLALGAPRRGPGRVTVGFVSAVDRPFRGPRGRRLRGLEHTAPVGRGSSGGPITDLDGNLVGINTHRRGDGFYLALPVTSDLRQRIDRLVAGDTPRRPRLGVAIAPAVVARRLRAAVGLPPRDGVLVRGVEEDAPAARAGVREGDLVVAAAGEPVASSDDLFAALEAAGETLVLGLVRGETEIEVTVTFDTE